MIKQKPELTPQMLGLIDGAMDRSLKMLDELRQRTREEPLMVAPTDLRKLVEDTARETPHPPKVSIKVEAEDVAKVSVDHLKVRRILENLINNAVESIRTEGTVSVTLRNVGDGLEFEVADDGRGIPGEEMVNLFKPFYTTKPGGMGLGLAFCKRTIEAHGGSIGVKSEEGKGTTVTFKLPWSRIRID
jgi:two-component system sensor kinase FixL